MLTQVNVWLDVVFTTLYVVIVLALSAHFLGNILTGRAYRRFIGWEWPQHEGPPVPVLPRFLHFQHVAMMILLGFTGMMIRFQPWNRSFLRYVHYFAMIVVTVNVVWRLWYAFYSKQRDYREFAITSRDITTALQVVMYYIFIKPSKPHLGKYNVLQKGTYILFVPLMLLQAFTGFALLTQGFIFGFSPRDLLIGWWLGPIVGGTAMAGAWARVVHYLINWLFIVLSTIHAYLSISEDLPAFLNFFGLGGGHHGEHGAEHGHGAAADAMHALSEAE